MTATLPWSQAPAALADVLRPVLPVDVDLTVSAIEREVSAYADALNPRVAPTIRRGVEIALARMLDLLGTDEPALDPRAGEFYRRLGAGEAASGRSLESLLSAYRTGARVSWEVMSAAAEESGISTQDLIVLAESIFVYIDHLSAASAEGHAAAQAARSGSRDVARAQLADALLEGEAGNAPARVSRLAEVAQWPLPRTLAVAVTDGAAAPADALVSQRDPLVVLIVPDPAGPGRLDRLRAAVAESTVTLGTIRPPAEAPVSLAHALRLRSLAADGWLPVAAFLAAADHMTELAATADEPLLRELAAEALAPLAGVPAGRRAPLEATLRAWLALGGDRAAVAKSLAVHPQTISYRMARLHELFGSALDDPRNRLTLQLSLLVPSDPV